MPSYLSKPADWVKVAVIAYIAVKAVNFALDRIGKSEFKV